MATARPGPLDRRPGRPGKGGFAKRASAFVNRVRGLPGFPVLWIGGAVAVLFMTLVGGFSTHAMPLGQRIAFWSILMLWNTIKWQTWFALTVRRREDWMRAAALSTIPLSLPIPFEIGFTGWLVGVRAPPPGLFAVWGKALAVGALIFVVAYLLVRRVPRAQPEEEVAAPPPGGLLDRARVEPEALAAIEAEDHYCRVRRSDGQSALVHYRFGDALGEVAGIDGAQVHRGSWVAAAAVKGAERDGRRWRLVLADGSRVTVSATYVVEARRRGWLRAP